MAPEKSREAPCRPCRRRVRTCQICNIPPKNRVRGRWMKLSRLQGAPASIRFDSRNAGATAVRVGLAATQGWGERGPSATLAGIGTDFAEPHKNRTTLVGRE